jgi:hypothetical protein
LANFLINLGIYKIELKELSMLSGYYLLILLPHRIYKIELKVIIAVSVAFMLFSL